MASDDVAARLRQVIAQTFQLDDAALPPCPGQEDIEEWDSLGHLRVVLAVEAEFGVAFRTDRIPLLTSFGALKEELANVLG
jgi:acyl carrier protein